MYGQRPDQLILRHEFEARVWNAGETFADYLHDKVTLANRVPISDTEIISYIIEGVPSQELRTQAKVQRYESVDAMLTAFADVPSSKGTSHRSSTQSRGDPSTPGKNKQLQGKEQNKIKGVNPRKCYNCNETGHFAMDCSKPKRERGSCFKCGQFGHLASQCSTPKEDVNYVAQEQRKDDDVRRTIEHHLRVLEKVFKLLTANLLELRLDKCRFL